MNQKPSLQDMRKILMNMKSLKVSRLNDYAFMANDNYRIILYSWGFDDYKLMTQRLSLQDSITMWRKVEIEEFLDNIPKEAQDDILFNINYFKVTR
jgi:hypothetical protein